MDDKTGAELQTLASEVIPLLQDGLTVEAFLALSNDDAMALINLRNLQIEALIAAGTPAEAAHAMTAGERAAHFPPVPEASDPLAALAGLAKVDSPQPADPAPSADPAPVLGAAPADAPQPAPASTTVDPAPTTIADPAPAAPAAADPSPVTDVPAVQAQPDTAPAAEVAAQPPADAPQAPVDAPAADQVAIAPVAAAPAPAETAPVAAIEAAPAAEDPAPAPQAEAPAVAVEQRASVEAAPADAVSPELQAAHDFLAEVLMGRQGINLYVAEFDRQMTAAERGKDGMLYGTLARLRTAFVELQHAMSA